MAAPLPARRRGAPPATRQASRVPSGGARQPCRSCASRAARAPLAASRRPAPRKARARAPGRAAHLQQRGQQLGAGGDRHLFQIRRVLWGWGGGGAAQRRGPFGGGGGEGGGARGRRQARGGWRAAARAGVRAASVAPAAAAAARRERREGAGRRRAAGAASMRARPRRGVPAPARRRRPALTRDLHRPRRGGAAAVAPGRGGGVPRGPRRARAAAGGRPQASAHPRPQRRKHPSAACCRDERTGGLPSAAGGSAVRWNGRGHGRVEGAGGGWLSSSWELGARAQRQASLRHSTALCARRLGGPPANATPLCVQMRRSDPGAEKGKAFADLRSWRQVVL
mgnify:CR=1 FL=1